MDALAIVPIFAMLKISKHSDAIDIPASSASRLALTVRNACGSRAPVRVSFTPPPLSNNPIKLFNCFFPGASVVQGSVPRSRRRKRPCVTDHVGRDPRMRLTRRASGYARRGDDSQRAGDRVRAEVVGPLQRASWQHQRGLGPN